MNDVTFRDHEGNEWRAYETYAGVGARHEGDYLPVPTRTVTFERDDLEFRIGSTKSIFELTPDELRALLEDAIAESER